VGEKWVSVKQWVRHYKDKGIDGLKEKQRSGRPSKARNQNHTKLLQSILAMQNDKNGGRSFFHFEYD
jgi:transposase